MTRGLLKRLRSIGLIGERSEGTFRRPSSADAGLLIYDPKSAPQFASFKRRPARQTLSALRPIPGVKQNTNSFRSELRGPIDIADGRAGSLATRMGVPEQDLLLRATGWRRTDTHLRTYLTVAYSSGTTLTVASSLGFSAAAALRIAIGWGTTTGEDATISTVPGSTSITLTSALTRTHNRVTAVRTGYLASSPGAVLDVTLTHGSRFVAGDRVCIDIGTAQEEFLTVSSSTADTVTFTSNMLQDHDVASVVTAEEVVATIRSYTPESDQNDHLYGIPYKTLAAGDTAIPVASGDGARLGTGTVVFGAGTPSEETVSVSSYSSATNTLTISTGLKYAHARTTVLAVTAAQGATSLTVATGTGASFSTYDRLLLDPAAATEETVLVIGVVGDVLLLAAGLQRAHSKVTAVAGGGTTAGSNTNVQVTSSTGFAIGDKVVIGFGTSNAESCVVTAVPDGTHVTVASTANNHSATESFTVSLLSGELLERTDYAISVSASQQTEGREIQTRGARGNSKFGFKAGEPAFVDATQLGAWQEQVDQDSSDTNGNLVKRYNPRYNTKEPPPFLSATLTINSSFAPVFTTIELDSGNQLQIRTSANDPNGNLSCLIVDREVTGRMDPEAALASTYPWIQQWESGTALPLSWQCGTTSRNRIGFSVPLAVLTQIADEDRNEIDVYGVEFSASSLAGSVGDDEVTVTYS